MRNAEKAVELLQDWSKWVVTIDTAAIGILGYTILTDSKHPGEAPIFKSLTCYQQGLVIAALFGFGVSLLSASWLLLALPGVLQRYQESDENDIFCRGTFNDGGVKVVFFRPKPLAFLMAHDTATVSVLIQSAGGDLLDVQTISDISECERHYLTAQALFATTEADIDFCLQFSPAFSALTNDKLMIYERNLSQSH